MSPSPASPSPASPSPAAQVAVVLSGCGYLDGAEINEAVISLLALSRAGAQVSVYAPDKEQMHVVDHLSGEPVPGERRNVLHESARITRGKIAPLAQLDPTAFDALFLPGGFGVAKNLSTFAVKGTAGQVEPELARVVAAFHTAGKPIGAVCISPAVLVMALHQGTVTIGSDPGTAAAIEAMGGTHVACPVRQAVIDRAGKLVTAPAYMEDASLADIAAGIERAVAATLEMVG